MYFLQVYQYFPDFFTIRIYSSYSQDSYDFFKGKVAFSISLTSEVGVWRITCVFFSTATLQGLAGWPELWMGFTTIPRAAIHVLIAKFKRMTKIQQVHKNATIFIESLLKQSLLI
jgi:hypothetical protein